MAEKKAYHALREKGDYMKLIDYQFLAFLLTGCAGASEQRIEQAPQPTVQSAVVLNETVNSTVVEPRIEGSKATETKAPVEDSYAAEIKAAQTKPVGEKMQGPDVDVYTPRMMHWQCDRLYLTGKQNELLGCFRDEGLYQASMSTSLSDICAVNLIPPGTELPMDIIKIPLPRLLLRTRHNKHYIILAERISHDVVDYLTKLAITCPMKLR